MVRIPSQLNCQCAGNDLRNELHSWQNWQVMNTFYNCNETYDGQNDVLELELFIAYGQELDTTSQNRHKYLCYQPV